MSHTGTVFSSIISGSAIKEAYEFSAHAEKENSSLQIHKLLVEPLYVTLYAENSAHKTFHFFIFPGESAIFI